VPLSDWYYKPAFELNEQAQMSTRGPPEPDNILVNGKHKSASGTGEYYKMTVKKVLPLAAPMYAKLQLTTFQGKKYRIRLINTSVDTTFHVSFDGHPFTVMTSDFVSPQLAPPPIGLALIHVRSQLSRLTPTKSLSP
jgi:FtsP/CotA-like multicopper oxidase with cupredoxin domain